MISSFSTLASLPSTHTFFLFTPNMDSIQSSTKRILVSQYHSWTYELQSKKVMYQLHTTVRLNSTHCFLTILTTTLQSIRQPYTTHSLQWQSLSIVPTPLHTTSSYNYMN
eukprot:Lithocolla_globosa_v1_NODE_378_length_4234_cov_4.842344.p5 type:complete len:110 gc:universal NODE_378_length_4234_cov_4.842344:3110-3439(+)